MAINPLCLPRIMPVTAACGCSLTKTSVQTMTPARFEALANQETAVADVIARSAEAKALGVVESPLSMLFMGAVRNIKPEMNKVTVDRQSINAPYIFRRQKNIVNANYFIIEAGEASPLAGTTVDGITYPANTWRIKVAITNSPWASPISALERYFPRGLKLMVLTWDDTSAKTALTQAHEIIAAEHLEESGQQKAYVHLTPDVLAANWAAFSAGEKALWQPTMGVVQTGANNVSDYESWCFENPSENPMKLLTFWLQTSRTSRCMDQAYKETLAKIMNGDVNPYMESFSTFTSIQEQNRQKAMQDDNQWATSIWYGRKKYGQDVNDEATWDAVTDPEDASCTLGYKAQASGVQELLEECARVVDLNGGPLDIDFIFEQLYLLKRHRKAQGDRNIDTIDCFTDRHTALMIKLVMEKWFRAQYGANYQVYFQPGQKITNEGMTLFEYDLYDIREAGNVRWAVFSEEFFDDHVSAFSGNIATAGVDMQARGRNLWMIDWSDIVVGIAEANSVKRTWPRPEYQELYKCRMAANVKDWDLRSQTWTVILERPHRHLLIHNFSLEQPKKKVFSYEVPYS